MGATFAEIFASRPEPPPSRTGIVIGGVALAATLLLTILASVSAGANSGESGTDRGTPTVLDYSDAHEGFRLRVRVGTPQELSGPHVSGRYSITFYDARSRKLWNATDHRSRVYTVGSDVARIVITREDRVGSVTSWRRN